MVVERSSKYNGCLTSSPTEVGLYEARVFCYFLKVIVKSGFETGEERCVRCRGVYLNHCVKYKMAHYCSACVCIYTQKNTFKILYVLFAKMREISSPTKANQILTNLKNARPT